MRPGAIVMTVLMIAVAVGVYFGLDKIPPGLVPGLNDQPEPESAQPMPEQPLVSDTGTAEVTARMDELSPGTEDPITEDDLAEEPPPTVIEPEPAVPVAPLSGAVDADPSADQAFADDAAPAEPAPPPANETAASDAAATEPAAEPEPQPTQVARASAPSAADKPRQPVKPVPPAADAIKPWWPDPATVDARQLKLQYAGQVANEQSIALLFSAPVNLETLRKYAEVQNATGDRLRGQWELGKNPRMAVLRGLEPGRYTVILDPAVADAQGYMLGMALQGPVYIQPPQ